MAIKLNNPVINTPSTPPGILVSDYYHNDDSYQVYRSAGTKDWLMIYTLSGEGSIRMNGNHHRCTAGTIAIWPPGVTQDYYTVEKSSWEMVWCHFIPKPAWVEWINHIPKVDSMYFSTISGDHVQGPIIHSFRKVIRYNLHPLNRFHLELALNALEETILLLANYFFLEDDSAQQFDPRIREVIEFLTEKYHRPIQVSELAQHVSLSASRLAHLYKEQVGESIIETLTKIRLMQAERLIKHTTRTISEISYDVGFKTPDYFTRKYTEYFGDNPSSHRRKSHKN